MKRFWISWYSAGAFEYKGPWWCSGVAYDRDASDNEVERPMFVAAIRAESEERAKAIIVTAHDEPPAAIEWRFCNEKPAHWSPFCERFPSANWMEWPNG